MSTPYIILPSDLFLFFSTRPYKMGYIVQKTVWLNARMYKRNIRRRILYIEKNKRDIPLLFIPYIVLFVIEETKWRNLHKSHYVQDTPTEKKQHTKKHTLSTQYYRCHSVWIGSMSFRIDRNYACWYFLSFFMNVFFMIIAPLQWVKNSIQLKFMLTI